MADLLRKVKQTTDSTFHHPDADTTLPRHLNQHKPRFDDFRRKLAGKVSTFSLRSKNRRGGGKSSDPRSRAHTFIAFENEIEAYQFELNPGEPTLIGTALSKEPSLPHLQSFERYKPATLHSGSSASPSHLYLEASRSELEAECEHIRLQQAETLQEGYLRSFQDHQAGINWSKMASEQAGPPVTYERLRQLTTEACDSTLSSIKAYAHANTESWNTAIINTILAALVTEATPTTGDAQPNYKFIVNSTIIQHAPISSSATDDAVRSAGRRGMHSASGAFWNNERDGMWSFKYEAAEAKGLDVVVGIVWIWVG